jgi:hypothetical protein
MRFALLLPPLLISGLIIAFYVINPGAHSPPTPPLSSQLVGETVNKQPTLRLIFSELGEKTLGLEIGTSQFILDLKQNFVEVKEGEGNTSVNITLSYSDFMDIRDLINNNNFREAAVLFVEMSRFEPPYLKFEMVRKFI